MMYPPPSLMMPLIVPPSLVPTALSVVTCPEKVKLPADIGALNAAPALSWPETTAMAWPPSVTVPDELVVPEELLLRVAPLLLGPEVPEELVLAALPVLAVLPELVAVLALPVEASEPEEVLELLGLPEEEADDEPEALWLPELPDALALLTPLLELAFTPPVAVDDAELTVICPATPQMPVERQTCPEPQSASAWQAKRSDW